MYSTQRKGEFMRKKIEMSRLSIYIPSVLYNRIDSDSKQYGITKTALLQTMIVNYYRSIDTMPPASDSAYVKGQACC